MATIEELPDDYVEKTDAPQSAEQIVEASNNESDQGEGGNTNSSINQSMDQSFHNSEAGDGDSNAPLSSRGSTKATGKEDSMSLRSADTDRVNGDYIEGRGYRHSVYGLDQEEQKDIDGSPMMTNRFFWELFRKEWKKYYRTPSLNEKMYLHYKGFSYIRNMEQFTGLKCLYFEGNGCKSMLGLEHCTEMRSLFMQENMINKIEGLQHMKELRQLNVSENMIQKIEGLEHCPNLDALHMKRNRLGRYEGGSIESLKGLLDCPSINCLDIQDNYLDDPAILDEILVKMPKLKVLYLMNNPCVKQIQGYRKTIITRIPTLTYLDDRPVFEEDRRRAEAWSRGGIEAEREEMKKIKKEKDDKHWANHEAFRLMVNKARHEKKTEEQANKEAKEYKKKSMKEMMAAARIAKEEGRGEDVGQFAIKHIDAATGEAVYEPNELQLQTDFYNGVKQKADEKFKEKQEGKITKDEDDHGEEFPLPTDPKIKELSKEFEKKYEQEAAAEFASLKSTVKDKNVAEALQKEFDKNTQGKSSMKIEEVKDIKTDEPSATVEEVQDDAQDDDDAPDLEEVNLEELEKSKEDERAKFLAKVMTEQEELKKQNDQKDVPKKTEEETDEEKQQKEMEKLEEILLDEKKCQEVQNKITATQIDNFITEQVEAAVEKDGTDFDELD